MTTPSPFLTNLFSLEGKTAVVIGGTGELCGAMAEGMAEAGAEVVLVGRSQEKADVRIESIERKGGKASFIAGDLGSREKLDELRDAVLEQNGKVDILVNGAGTNSATPFLEISDEEAAGIIDTNS